ncbi:MAG: hypothetical protein V3S12_03415, partial [Acidiferrobacterales bacterium]
MTLFEEIVEQTEKLSHEEKLRLIAHLAEQSYLPYQKPTSAPRHWYEIKGAAPYPLLREDAQAWVTRTRRVNDDHRKQQQQDK